ncbi:hypothetical protein D3C76_943010 [compost metagenome]
MLGSLMIGLGVAGLAVQLSLGLLLWPHWGDAGVLTRAVDSTLYWQFVFLVPSLPLAFGAFLLRYRVRCVAQFRSERLNCAAFLLISAGIALVLGKLLVLLVG